MSQSEETITVKRSLLKEVLDEIKEIKRLLQEGKKAES